MKPSSSENDRKLSGFPSPAPYAEEGYGRQWPPRKRQERSWAGRGQQLIVVVLDAGCCRSLTGWRLFAWLRRIGNGVPILSC